MKNTIFAATTVLLILYFLIQIVGTAIRESVSNAQPNINNFGVINNNYGLNNKDDAKIKSEDATDTATDKIFEEVEKYLLQKDQNNKTPQKKRLIRRAKKKRPSSGKAK